MACLIITSGDNAGSSFDLSKAPLSAGRDAVRDIQIVDPKVSRRHFVIKKDGDGFSIIEQDAKNGVYINGKKLAEAKLKDGDRIVVGNTELTFLESSDPAAIDALKKLREISPATRAQTMM